MNTNATISPTTDWGAVDDAWIVETLVYPQAAAVLGGSASDSGDGRTAYRS